MWFFFFLFAIVALAGAIGVVTLRNPFYCVLSLVVHLIALALLFLLLEAQFVAVAQIIVYAGAVMVLYVFVVAYVGGGDQPVQLWRANAKQRALAIAFGVALFAELCVAMLGTSLSALDGDGAQLGPGYGSPGEIGELLLVQFLLPVRAGLVPAAGRGRRRRRARRPAAGHRRRRPAGRAAPRARRVPPLGRDRDDGRRRRGLRRHDRAARRARGRGRRGRAGGGAGAVSVNWYLVVSALIFSIGAVGVLIRRNPLVVLLCLELMLNAGNLALLGFARAWGDGDGQIFAIVVMVVAACEVAIGLGIVVALYRRRLPIDVDELRELHG